MYVCEAKEILHLEMQELFDFLFLVQYKVTFGKSIAFVVMKRICCYAGITFGHIRGSPFPSAHSKLIVICMYFCTRCITTKVGSLEKKFRRNEVTQFGSDMVCDISIHQGAHQQTKISGKAWSKEMLGLQHMILVLYLAGNSSRPPALLGCSFCSSHKTS